MESRRQIFSGEAIEGSKSSKRTGAACSPVSATHPPETLIGARAQGGGCRGKSRWPTGRVEGDRGPGARFLPLSAAERPVFFAPSRTERRSRADVEIQLCRAESPPDRRFTSGRLAEVRWPAGALPTLWRCPLMPRLIRPSPSIDAGSSCSRMVIMSRRRCHSPRPPAERPTRPRFVRRWAVPTFAADNSPRLRPSLRRWLTSTPSTTTRTSASVAPWQRRGGQSVPATTLPSLQTCAPIEAITATTENTAGADLRYLSPRGERAVISTLGRVAGWGLEAGSRSQVTVWPPEGPPGAAAQAQAPSLRVD